ncbi:MAG: enolase C-terminal domain-like protein [Jatrophihabitantaceae bacterium]
MRIQSVNASVYRFPTPQPEADGTLEWDATTAVVVQVAADDVVGLGWTYSTAAAATIIRDHLAGAVIGHDSDDITACFEAMRRAGRNLGTRGLVMQAISALDIALWDLKARAHDMSLSSLLGRVRDTVPVYGSGGFTTMSDEQLHEQVDEWQAMGCRSVKIKIGEAWGSRIEHDLARVSRLRRFAGADTRLMVDANGGYTRGQARRVGRALDDLGVVWFEEPVSSDDVEGLAGLRDALDCDVTAGEYAADLFEVERLTRVVDCLQLDATRCGGYTGFLHGAAVAAVHNLDVSAHCGPALHVPIAAAVANFRHIEYFADHARLEPLLVEGVSSVQDGALTPNDSAGNGYTLRADVSRWQTESKG